MAAQIAASISLTLQQIKQQQLTKSEHDEGWPKGNRGRRKPGQKTPGTALETIKMEVRAEVRTFFICSEKALKTFFLIPLTSAQTL
ncbi:hypothetical protein FVR03_22940 [Pontibacter qinzhouensis]|uniref:Uncharacterized protein n=1 Tax=Pontibacter qinzhouensis TaxID=2603253 RepID=A0A5C8IN16_9BACT|nr:hypothetical protein [Pontibacter qinzhouensis]TXK22521.1 hypothetical protein FVR03_22940 [Pontibacter qinzhouensis]